MTLFLFLFAMKLLSIKNLYFCYSWSSSQSHAGVRSFGHFFQFFTELIFELILRHSNVKMAEIRGNIGVANQDNLTYREISMIELKAVFGSLICAGARRDNHLNTRYMYRDDFGVPFYR